MDINILWNSNNEDIWKKAFDDYWEQVKHDNINLEREMNELNLKVKKFEDIDNWYSFLLNKYFRWKYTAPNRLKTTTNLFIKEYENDREKLNSIIKSVFRIFHLYPYDTKKCLSEVKKIRGLGEAGASGLLSLLFPEYYGTVDEFAMRNITKINILKTYPLIPRMKNKLQRCDENEQSLQISMTEAVFMIKSMRDKSKQLNHIFNTDFWTPRKIDMVLWGNRE